MRFKVIFFILILFSFTIFCSFAKECNKLPEGYRLRIVLSPNSLLKGSVSKLKIKNLHKITESEYSALFTKPITNEISNITLTKECNNLSFTLPFNFVDHKGITGKIDSTYLLDYNCQVLIKKGNGFFDGACLYNNLHLGDIQVLDKIDIFGNPI